MPVSIERRKIPSVDERLTLSLVHHRSRLLLIRVGPQQFENKTLRCLSETAQHSSIKRSFIMRPSSLGGGRIMRRTLSGRLSVCPSVCPSVPLSLPSVTSRHLANYNDTHVLFAPR